uniref:FAS1 domain-containing protein n=1 Tax=Kalanchoe fedtschenkoi TaxID=63787 RepID=A0A7N0RC55_KALFE
MQLILRPPTAMATLAISLIILLTHTEAHNITQILAKHPEFSTFNDYLSQTHLADEINGRQTITVCAVDNAAMSSLISKNLPISSIKNLLSLHVLLDYFGAKKLHQITNGTALAATMFQATGTASGSSGFVRITDIKGGKVGFATEDNGGNITATFVKSVEEIPYNISVIHISNLLPSSEAEAPVPAPSAMNLTAQMSTHGCKVFADTLSASSAALSTFQDDIEGGLTVFCPGDDAFKAFLPKYKNLTADGKVSLLLFHGLPVYNSMQMLRSNNGLMNTLATDGAKKFDFTVQNDGNIVTIDTKRVVAKITGTLYDEQPVAIFTLDKVLLPRELFNATEAPTPAPAPAEEAESPKAKKKVKPDPDTPADAPSDSADQAADDNGAVRFDSAMTWMGALGLSVWLSLFVI